MSPVRVSKRHGPDPVDVRCGQFVRMARLEAGLSQEKLADHLGVTFQQVQKYEKGTNRIGASRLQQISDIYSGKITNWQEVGGEDRPIVRLSRETNSGTHVYFLETVLRLGNSDDETLFSMDTLLLPSSEGIISEVRQNPNAIGYDGLGDVPDDVKMIAIAKEAGGEYVLPSIATVNDKTYAIARDLYMYTNGEPTGVVKDYLDWILSAEAQEIVAELGFVPAK